MTQTLSEVLADYDDNNAIVAKRPEPYSDKALKHDLIAMLQRATAEVQKTCQTVARSHSVLGVGEAGGKAQIDPAAYRLALEFAAVVATLMKKMAHEHRRMNTEELAKALGIDHAAFVAEASHYYRIEQETDRRRAAAGLPPEHEADIAQEAEDYVNGQVERHYKPVAR